MNEATRRRVEQLEAALRADGDLPGPLVFHVSERSFASTAELLRWTAARQKRNRDRSRALRPESVTSVNLVVVRRCAEGEQPSESAIGSMSAASAIIESGIKATGIPS
jgi:hypothetical protein